MIGHSNPQQECFCTPTRRPAASRSLDFYGECRRVYPDSQGRPSSAFQVILESLRSPSVRTLDSWMSLRTPCGGASRLDDESCRVATVKMRKEEKVYAVWCLGSVVAYCPVSSSNSEREHADTSPVAYRPDAR